MSKDFLHCFILYGQHLQNQVFQGDGGFNMPLEKCII